MLCAVMCTGFDVMLLLALAVGGQHDVDSVVIDTSESRAHCLLARIIVDEVGKKSAKPTIPVRGSGPRPVWRVH